MLPDVRDAVGSLTFRACTLCVTIVIINGSSSRWNPLLYLMLIAFAVV